MQAGFIHLDHQRKEIYNVTTKKRHKNLSLFRYLISWKENIVNLQKGQKCKGFLLGQIKHRFEAAILIFFEKNVRRQSYLLAEAAAVDFIF